MENYHKKDFKSKIRDMNNAKSKVTSAYEKTTLLAQKTSECYGKIEEFVQKEMKKGKTLEEAIKIVFDSKSLERLYPQLKEDVVKKKIISLIRKAQYSREKKAKNVEDGEIEL